MVMFYSYDTSVPPKFDIGRRLEFVITLIQEHYLLSVMLFFILTPCYFFFLISCDVCVGCSNFFMNVH